MKAIIYEQDELGTYTRPVWYQGSIYVNSDITTPGTKPFVIEYDNPDESDEEVDPFDGEDSIMLLDEGDSNLEQIAMNVRRETFRQGIKDAGLLHLETDKTQPDEETEPTGRWRVIHKPKRANGTTHDYVSVQNPKGKWVGDITLDRIRALYDRFQTSTQDPEMRQKLSPRSFESEIGGLLLWYRSGVAVDKGRKVEKEQVHEFTEAPECSSDVSIY